MSAMSRAIRACAVESRASTTSLASVDSMGAGGAWAKGPPAAERCAGRGGRGPVEDGARVQWVFVGCPGVGKATYAGRLLRLHGVPPHRHRSSPPKAPLSKQELRLYF